MSIIPSNQCPRTDLTPFFSQSRYIYSFSRETPQRFRKEIAKAFPATEGKVPADDLNSVLSKIGMKDSLLTKEEIDNLLLETGTPQTRMLSIDQLMKLM